MTAFRCIPMPSETAARWRATGLDDRGNPLIRRTVAPNTLAPCRHCLRDALPGEEVFLGSYNLPGPTGEDLVVVDQQGDYQAWLQKQSQRTFARR